MLLKAKLLEQYFGKVRMCPLWHIVLVLSVGDI
jgi:hypothetical protein